MQNEQTQFAVRLQRIWMMLKRVDR